MTRDKTHMEFVERWANFVRNNPRRKWKPRLNEIVDSQFEKTWEFYKNLEKTEKGKEILKRLREERLRNIK